MIESNNFILLIGLILISILFIVLYWLPKRQMQSLTINPTSKKEEEKFEREKERLKLEDDARKTLAQIIGGAIIFAGLVFTYNTYQLNVTKQDLDREGQMTERFSKAIEHLGDEKLSVRLGGLFELERIAKDSPKDHWTVMEVISAFIREKDKKSKSEIEASEKLINKNDNQVVNDSKITQENKLVLQTDVLTALKIIGRRKVENDLKGFFIDLKNVDFDSINFEGANLANVDLTGSNLINCKFKNVNLSGANLDQARLSYYPEDFEKENTQTTDLRGRNPLDLISFDGSPIFYNTTIEDRFEGANFKETILNQVVLYEVDLSKTTNLNLEQLEKSIICKSTKLPTELESKKDELILKTKANMVIIHVHGSRDRSFNFTLDGKNIKSIKKKTKSR